MKKYISLFPPEARQKGDSKGKGKESREQEEAKENAATDAQRDEIRQQIRAQMEKGELGQEPELEDHSSRTGVGLPDAPDHQIRKNVESQSEKGGGSGSGSGSARARVPEIAEDEFFGDESGEDDGMDED